ncbi:MAG: hypothetical protein P8176_14085 [Gammaproteobacteria bacterium]
MTTSAAVSLILIALTVTITIILLRQVRPLRKSTPNPSLHSTQNETQHAAHIETHMETQADAPAIATPSTALCFTPTDLARPELFSQLIAPFSLQASPSPRPDTALNQWLPAHIMSELSITKHSLPPYYGLTFLNSATTADNDFYVFLCLCQSSPASNPETDCHIALLIRSYRLCLTPSPIKIYSHALEATAEGFHDTLLLYRKASPAPMETHQAFLTDAITIFDSLGTPPNPQARANWLQHHIHTLSTQ